MNPDIAVIIPFYNRPERVRQAYASVCAQCYRNIEVLLVDDGSDCRDEDLRQLVVSNGHQVLYQEHQGVSAARNAGILNSQAPWIALLDSDDAWLPDKLTRQRAYHASNPDILISQTEEIWYWQGVRVKRKKILRPPEGDIFARSLTRCLVSSSSTLIHRSVFDRVGLYNQELPACEDYDIWLRMALQYQFGLLADPVVIKYGGHEDQLSKKYPAMDRYRIYALLSLLSSASMLETQRELVLEELERKCDILRKGAVKKSAEVLVVLNLLEEELIIQKDRSYPRFSQKLLQALLREPSA